MSAVNIGWLPEELLLQIFSDVAAIYSADSLFWSPYKWISVTHVCRLWRRFALGCPTLWTDITILRVECVAAMLARSRSALLSISIAEGFEHTKERRSRVLKLIRANKHRIRELDLQELPRLKTFSDSEWGLQLERVHLFAYDFTWQDRFFHPGLKYLSISADEFRETSSAIADLHEMLEALRRMPNLETFIMDRPANFNTFPGFVQDAPVTLSKMQEITMVGTGERTAYILGKLSIPATTRINLRVGLGSPEEVGMLSNRLAFRLSGETSMLASEVQVFRTVQITIHSTTDFTVRGYRRYQPRELIHIGNNTDVDLSLSVTWFSDGEPRGHGRQSRSTQSICTFLPISGARHIYIVGAGGDAVWTVCDLLYSCGRSFWPSITTLVLQSLDFLALPWVTQELIAALTLRRSHDMTVEKLVLSQCKGISNEDVTAISAVVGSIEVEYAPEVSSTVSLGDLSSDTAPQEPTQTVADSIPQVKDAPVPQERVSISFLPKETLLQIFEDFMMVHLQDCSKSPYGWISVTHICRAWRWYAVHYAPLWTQIVAVSPDCLKEVLKRSRPMPISFTLDNHLKRELRPACLKLILSASQMRRIQHLKLHSLDRLKLLSEADWGFRLERLVFDSYDFSWRDRFFHRNIRHLNITGPLHRELSTTSTSLQEMFDALRRMPLLEELLLESPLTSKNFPGRDIGPVVDLLKLRTFKLSGSGERCAYIMDQLSFPPTVTILLICDISTNDEMKQLGEAVTWKLSGEMTKDKTDADARVLQALAIWVEPPPKQNTIQFRGWREYQPPEVVLRPRLGDPDLFIALDWVGDISPSSGFIWQATAFNITRSLPVSHLRDVYLVHASSFSISEVVPFLLYNIFGGAENESFPRLDTLMLYNVDFANQPMGAYDIVTALSLRMKRKMPVRRVVVTKCPGMRQADIQGLSTVVETVEWDREG
ncbi:hypothetical protein BXZ70DRAFT_19153 [Cristinia sonorae]|uniref:F-box domain-containing protein n=1 Tax=Cristinia sonorae TaxID=1940300 RepID=A0A8K0V1R1_9AGAR|nr:hypothetical protein BXZ70DRAFT_19153 [Cristinia sonorae]